MKEEYLEKNIEIQDEIINDTYSSDLQKEIAIKTKETLENRRRKTYPSLKNLEDQTF